MNILLAFAPFIAFAVVDRILGPVEGLVCAAVVAAVMLARDLLHTGSVKILDIGTAVLFTGLAAYALATDPDWSVAGVRLRVDSGLLLIVLITLLVRRPFTLQYAREQAPKEIWDSPEFIAANYKITGVWAAAFAALVVADAIWVYMPDLPHWFGLAITIGALSAAVKYTSSYAD